jgi:hypothetical protein
MKEFETSRNFVSRVMQDVRAYEASRNLDASWSRVFLSTPFARYALSAAGGLLGVINLVRIYLTLFSPVVCR